MSCLRSANDLKRCRQASSKIHLHVHGASKIQEEERGDKEFGEIEDHIYQEEGKWEVREGLTGNNQFFSVST